MRTLGPKYDFTMRTTEQTPDYEIIYYENN